MAVVAVAAKAAFAWVASNAAATFVAKMLLSTAVSALSAHLQRQAARRNQPGIKTDYTTDGGTQPQKFVLGWYATDGHMVCPPMSHGKDNGYLTYVIDLGNVPGAQLESIIVDDEEVEFEAASETGPIDGPVPPAGMPDWWYQQQGLNPLAQLFGLTTTDLGRPALGNYKGKVWLRYYDGSQTAADPYLLQIYGPGTAWARRSERPWTAEMVGIGTSYAILTFKFDRDVFTGLPRCRFVMRGIPLYDPRRDASVGGDGSQRWDDPSTWAPTANGMVLAYNILRGIPIDGGPLWGYGVAAADLPLPEWTAAMTAADQIVDDAPRWQAGWEVAVDEEPADVLDEVLKVCCAKVAEVGGVWKPRVGAPAAPVLFVTDDDLILDRDATLTPFPGLEATFNAIHASYPEPTALWRPKDAPPRYNEAWEAADQGRRLTAELNLPACPWEPQVQRVMRAYIEEERRFARHVITLPPDAEALEPLDVIAWTSDENGYDAKLFEVHEITEDPDTLLVTLSLREVDPADYHWQPEFRLPSWVPPVTKPRPDPMVPEYFTAQGIAMADATGRGRQAAGRLRWGGWALDGITGVMWEIRRAGETDTLRGMMADPVAGETIAPGLAPSAGYEARIRFLAGAASAPMDWTAWTPFATPAIEITLEDLGGAPPTAPTGLALTSVPGTLTASWSAATGAIAHYEIEITEGASAPLIFQTAGLRYEWTGIRPGRNFSVRIRAVGELGRKSPWTNPVTHVSIGDTVPPAVPTGLVIKSGFNALWLDWNRNSEEDFDYYEVAAGAATNPTAIVARTPATSFALTELPDNATRYMRIRAVDTSGNRSGWTATVSKATVAAPDITLTTEKLAGLVDATSFASGVQPIRIWSGSALPTTRLTDTLSWGGKLYRWSGTAYVADVLADKAIQTAHLDAGVVTGQKMAIGFGGNLLTNTDFSAGTACWSIAGTGAVHAATGINLQPPGGWAGSTYPTLRIHQNNTETDGYTDLTWRPRIDNMGNAGIGYPVKADDWIELSVNTSAHRCNAQLRLQWLDESGASVGYTGAVGLTNAMGGATSPESWNRGWVRGQSPEGAAYVRPHIRKFGTLSGTNSYLFLHKPMMAYSSADRTEPTPYAPDAVTIIDGTSVLTDTLEARHMVKTAALLTTSAQIKDAIITNAKIVELSAAKLMAGTALATTITVSGEALSSIHGKANNPAAQVNTGTTRIDPGKIVISGGTTLADWRKGGDETRIDGGVMAPNTLRANAAVIGQRNITLSGVMFEHNDPSPNHVSWTAGAIQHINDNNVPVTVPIAAGSAAWASGTLYLYWRRGDSAVPLRASNNLGVAMGADNVILASYRGGTLLDSTYGRTVIDEDGIKTGAVKAHHVEVEELSALSGRMGVLEVNDRLTISESGSLLSFKAGPHDDSDGLFFGQTGSNGFAFSASRTSQSGLRQSVDLRDTGFTLHNARHTVSGSVRPPAVIANTSRTVNIPAGTSRISMTIVGAGGGGWGGLAAGSPGTATTAVVRDGTNVVSTWTAPGGLGGSHSNTWKGNSGQPSVLAAGGRAGWSDRQGDELFYYPGDPGSLGSGGGGRKGGYPGGMAGKSVEVLDFDISSLSNPNIVITVGIGGNPGSSGSSGGGKGGNGAVHYHLDTDIDIPADVVPLKPTAWGTITKTGLDITFPDLGGGLWTLFCDGDVNMDIGWVRIAPNQGIFCHRGMTTFVSSQTPVRTTGGWSGNRTIHYRFYSMGSWA